MQAALGKALYNHAKIISVNASVLVVPATLFQHRPALAQSGNDDAWPQQCFT